MKKTINAWLLIAALLSLSITAYAQDQTTGSMEVTYEYTAPSGGDSGGGDDSGEGGDSGDSGGGDSNITTYTLNIPARISFAPKEAIPITATQNDIPDGKMIAITIDYDKTFSNGQFLLYMNKGEANQENMLCNISTYADGTLSTLSSLMARDRRVAEFTADSLKPTFGGYLCLTPEVYSQSSGAYIGEIYFNISVVDM